MVKNKLGIAYHRGPNDVRSSYNRKAGALDIDIAKVPKPSTGLFLSALQCTISPWWSRYTSHWRRFW